VSKIDKALIGGWTLCRLCRVFVGLGAAAATFEHATSHVWVVSRIYRAAAAEAQARGEGTNKQEMLPVHDNMNMPCSQGPCRRVSKIEYR